MSKKSIKAIEDTIRFTDSYWDREWQILFAMISLLRYQSRLHQLKKTIDYGEELIDRYRNNNLIFVDIVSALIPVIDERARYYSKYGYYYNREGEKDLLNAVEDYSYIIDLCQRTEKDPDIKFFLRRCEIFVELQNWEKTLEDANRIISLGYGPQGYLLRSKAYWGLGESDNAKSDTLSGLMQLRGRRDHEWFDLIKWYREINELVISLSELGLILIKTMYKQGRRVFEDMNLAYLEIFDCDFSHATFTNISFEGCHFRNVNFEGAKFQNVDFRYSTCAYRDDNRLNFANAKFSKTCFDYASLKADFTEAELLETQMSNARVVYSKFQNATIIDLTANQSNFSEGYFQNSKLERVDFTKSKFQRTDFSNSEFTDIDFSHTDLFESVNNDTTMRNVKFDQTNLAQASMINADVKSLTFDGAEICGLNISGVKNYDNQKFLKAARGLFGLRGIPIEYQLMNLEESKRDSISQLFMESNELPIYFRRFQRRIATLAQRLIKAKEYGKCNKRIFRQTPEFLVDTIIRNFTDSDYQILQTEVATILDKRIFNFLISEDLQNTTLGRSMFTICCLLFPNQYKKELILQDCFNSSICNLISTNSKIRETKKLIIADDETER